MTPTERHAAVLVALERVGGVAFGGRRRILERHCPYVYNEDFGHAACDWCRDVGWPCFDYRDAAVGLPDLPEAFVS